MRFQIEEEDLVGFIWQIEKIGSKSNSVFILEHVIVQLLLLALYCVS